MSKKYQTTVPEETAPAVPEQVSIAMEEITSDLQEGLLALAVGAGLQVMAQMMDCLLYTSPSPRDHG